MFLDLILVSAPKARRYSNINSIRTVLYISCHSADGSGLLESLIRRC